MLRGLAVRLRPEDQIPPAELERIDTLWDAMLSFGMVDVFTAVYLNSRSTFLALQAGESASNLAFSRSYSDGFCGTRLEFRARAGRRG